MAASAASPSIREVGDGHQPFIGQIRFGHRQPWVDVSHGYTVREAARGAASAFRDQVDPRGRRAVEVRVVPRAWPDDPRREAAG